MKETIYEVWSFESNEWVEADKYEYDHTEEKYRRITQSGAFRQPNRVDLMSVTERAITTAMRLVEEAGASEMLTNAGIKLGQARDLTYEHYRQINSDMQTNGASQEQPNSSIANEL